MSDPNWQQGVYYGKSLPARGMAVSHDRAHTYMSEQSMEEKFGRKLKGKEKVGYDFNHDFEVESYLKYRGDSFVQRFDANAICIYPRPWIISIWRRMWSCKNSSKVWPQSF